MSGSDFDNQIKELSNVLEELKSKSSVIKEGGFDYEKMLTNIQDETDEIFEAFKNLPPEELEIYRQRASELPFDPSDPEPEPEPDEPIQPKEQTKEINTIRICTREEKIFGDCPIKAMCLMSDNRIAFGSRAGEIIVYKFDLETKKAKVLGSKIKAHGDEISSLNVTTTNELISGSDDGNVKIWNVSNSISLKAGEKSVEKEEFKKCHEDSIVKVLGLNNGLIASGSYIKEEKQRPLKVWNKTMKKQSEYSEGNFSTFSIEQSRNEDLMLAVLTYGDKQTKLILFNSNDISQPLTSLSFPKCPNKNSMLALPNNHFAVLTENNLKIVEVNKSPASIKDAKTIEHDNINSNATDTAFSLTPDKETFVYTCEGMITGNNGKKEAQGILIQMEAKYPFNILKKHNMKNEFLGIGVVFMKTDNALFMVADNKQKGFTLFIINE